MISIYHTSSVSSMEAGDALSCGNYRCLKLQEHVMKILEHILNNIIREQVSINNMQLGFMPSRSTNDTISCLDSFKKSNCKRRKKSNLHLSTYKRLSIVHLVELFGGRSET